MEWQGATSFITGGAQGIGLGIARALARRGVKLALADIDATALRTAKAELEGVTPTETFELDVRDREAFAEAADRAEKALGPVTLLFNNAGIAPAVRVEDVRYADWDATLGINLHGVANGIQTFIPRLIERGQGGYIVNTASGAGLAAASGFLYTTSKYAVVGLSESLRRELASYDIDVSVLCPGPVDTGILDHTRRLEESASGRTPLAAVEKAARFLKSGASIDAVGEMVVKGMERRQTWIHTDAYMRPYVASRMEALLESFPADSA